MGAIGSSNSGSRRRVRTCLRRLTAGSPHRDGSTGIVSKMVAEFGGARRNRTGDILLAKQALFLLSYGPELVHKDGIEPPPRAPSTRRSTAELLVRIKWKRKCWSGRGESNSSSTRRQRATLPLSYGRGLSGCNWWAGMDSNHLRMNGAFTERWAHQCPACPKLVAGAEVGSALSSL